MRGDEDIERAIDRHGDSVLRACSAYLMSIHDADDAFQNTFIAYARSDKSFHDEEHRRAWLIRVAINMCKDHLKKKSSCLAPLDEAPETAFPPQDDMVVDRMEIRKALASISVDQRAAIVLSVVEGYTVPEIARMLDKPENTVYSLIARGKDALKKVLGHD